MKCYECGISFKKWEQTERDCDGSEHDWEEGIDEEGDAMPADIVHMTITD